MPDLNIRQDTVRLDELKLPAVNARTHPEKNQAAIRRSLQDFGQVEPIIAEEGTGEIIHGCGRYEQMIEMGWTSCRVWFVDAHSPQQKSALALVLNRSAELAGWDYETLASCLNDLDGFGIDANRLGWSQDDLDALGRLVDESLPSPNQNDVIPSGNRLEMGEPIRLTREQREIFDRAAEKIRRQEGDLAITDGRIAELLAAEWLSGA